MKFNYLILFIRFYAVNLLQLENARNFRPVLPDGRYPLYRSANLDNLSQEEAALLHSALLFDLRNQDEAAKRAKTEASQQLRPRSVPILENVNSFWESLREEMPISKSLLPTLINLWDGSALDIALTQYLEDGRHHALYRGILKSGARRIGFLLREILVASAQNKTIVFYCQKGKDRTGLVAALILHILHYETDFIIADYARSGPLLGGDEDVKDDFSTSNFVRSSPTDVNWSLFRGSPPDAMTVTLTWIVSTFGSVEAYLADCCDFSYSQQQQLKDNLLRISS
mmetsp:Transcript_7077/g.10557  ORF Transcript_7077/g.10557 Transcript_7077/m.10557 type:complete len:284 (-) Transcript_7077:34-885(-)